MNKYDTFMTGSMFTLLLALGMLYMPQSKVSKYDAAIAQCEQGGEKCVIAAKPVGGEDK